MPTVREIAEYAGVSKSTVSLVLNEKPGVSEEMRQRILEAVKQLNQRDQNWNGIRIGGQSENAHQTVDPYTILVLHPPQADDEVFTTLLQGVWSGRREYNVHLQLVANEPELPANHVAHLFFSDPALRPDGLLALGAKTDEALINKALDLRIPCVLVHRETVSTVISTVGVDEVALACETTEHLLSLRHRRIAFIGGEPEYSYTHSRAQGYKKAMQKYGLSVPDHWVSFGFDEEATERVLTQSPEITGIVFVNDGYALHSGIPVLEAAGRRIPDDISVVSFDNIKEARQFSPPLTSVEYDFYQESLRAVKILVEQIQNPSLRSQHIRFQAILHKRASCKPYHSDKTNLK